MTATEYENAGAHLIALERWRQVEQEGWTPDHDAGHGDFELTLAALAYAVAAVPGEDASGPPRWWPWHAGWWKPSDDPVRNLVKAGALVAAEIDRLLRARGGA